MFFELLNSKMRLAILFSLVLVPGLNSQSWQKVTGIDSIDVLSIVEHNNFLFSNTLYNIYTSTNGGESWQPVASLPNVTSDFNVLFSHGSYLYAGTNGDGVYRSSNNGVNWNSFSSGLSGFAKFITSFTVIGDSLYIGTDGDGVYLTNLQNPANWVVINNGLANFGVTSLATSGDYIVAGSGLYLYVKHRLESQWQNVFVDSNQVQRHYFTFETYNGYLFAGTDNGVYRGSLDAQTWEKADIDFFRGRDIVSMVQLGDELLVGLLYQGQHWMFSTDDNGSSWETRAHEFSFLWDMLVYNNKLWAGRSDGLWYYDILNWTDADPNIPNLIKDYSLKQNYPNPFNPTTTISYILPEAGLVRLTLYNILGQELRTLVNEIKETGTHTFNLDASGLNSGIYIYKIESGSFVHSKKMTLIK